MSGLGPVGRSVMTGLCFLWAFLTLFAYQEGFKKFNLGYTSALSFLFLIVIVVIGTIYLAVLRPHLERRR